jgi:hypothetical protein
VRLVEADADFIARVDADLGFHLLPPAVEEQRLVDTWRHLEGRLRVVIVAAGPVGAQPSMSRERHNAIIDLIERVAASCCRRDHQHMALAADQFASRTLTSSGLDRRPPSLGMSDFAAGPGRRSPLMFGRGVLLGRGGHVLFDHLHGGAEISALDRVDDRSVPISRHHRRLLVRLVIHDRHSDAAFEVPPRRHEHGVAGERAEQQVKAQVGFKLRLEVTVYALQTRQGITPTPSRASPERMISVTADSAPRTLKSSRTPWARSC